MAISSISMLTPTQVVQEPNKLTATPYEAQQNFAATLKEAIAKVNAQQIQSDTMTNKLINGGNVDLHEVMIAAQKASITLNATLEIRNKAVEAYQEIMRMSV
ncbi:flagellar hook-basal body complex protein FliE [Bacillus ndiopicus]|uniref:flagellar hook-basal body complex protein FliE n=1 Tax=Bacillus ndiopicus TaxID=1347368 RepID=UPI0005A8463E|nr:flagellar hook-basal body complex protein FliE [Bacillus ndiopicus]